jgi:hypothetical protein
MSSDRFNREEAAVQAVKHRVKSWTSATALRRPKEMFTIGVYGTLDCSFDSSVVMRSYA